jgi:hypothetical protein
MKSTVTQVNKIEVQEGLEVATFAGGCLVYGGFRIKGEKCRVRLY